MDNIPMGIHVELASDINVGRKKEEAQDDERFRASDK